MICIPGMNAPMVGLTNGNCQFYGLWWSKLSELLIKKKVMNWSLPFTELPQTYTLCEHCIHWSEPSEYTLFHYHQHAITGYCNPCVLILRNKRYSIYLIMHWCAPLGRTTSCWQNLHQKSPNGQLPVEPKDNNFVNMRTFPFKWVYYTCVILQYVVVPYFFIWWKIWNCL